MLIHKKIRSVVPHGNGKMVYMSLKGFQIVILVLDKEIFLVDTGMPGGSNEIIRYLEKNLKSLSPHDIEKPL